jgi:hypothetical protein
MGFCGVGDEPLCFITTNHQSPWSRDLEKLIISQLGKKFPCLLQSLKVNNCVHKSLLLDPTLTQLNPVHTVTVNLCNIH